MSSSERIGLALGGGGARGMGHIPIIMAMEELGLKPARIAGTSIGGLVGAALASGMSGADLQDYFLKTFSKVGDVAATLWSIRPMSFQELRRRGLRLSQFSLEEILRGFLPDCVPFDFAQLQIPLSVVAADILSGEMVVMNDGDLRSAISASAALPGIFAPVRRDGYLLVDGAVCNPVPVDCIGDDVDKIIAIDIIGFEENLHMDKKPSTLETLFAANMISQRSLMNTRFLAVKPDLVLVPPVAGIYVLDFMSAKKILDRVIPYKEEAKRQIATLFD
ncbi:patatin-like phospholipase family protein [Bartonella sp. HY038]|uniref:patatin-like phospholipase family protein n=1 Tax=Bartonella sp. HY038 TaxID=2759660 RepID=UPI0015F8F420|nr:patatin-like phospholipase family protein [Bartonella sp. HY038]